ncbi:MAG: hypothetical protein RI955_1219, partial [Bacteroidota bacterium]
MPKHVILVGKLGVTEFNASNTEISKNMLLKDR